MNGIDVLYKEIKCCCRKKSNFKYLDGIFEKIGTYACSFFVIDGKMMIVIAGEST